MGTEERGEEAEEQGGHTCVHTHAYAITHVFGSELDSHSSWSPSKAPVAVTIGQVTRLFISGRIMIIQAAGAPQRLAGKQLARRAF